MSAWRIWTDLERRFEDERAYLRAALYVPIFYIFLEFMALNQLAAIDAVKDSVLTHFWPIAWLWFVPGAAGHAAPIFLLVLLGACMLGAIGYRYRLARILVFFAVFQFQAYRTALTGSEHEFYIPLFVSFLFIFLPSVMERVPPLDVRKKFLIVYWGAIAYIGSVYFMSGFVKLIGACVQLAAGQTSIFSPDAAALYTANILTMFDRTSILGPFIIEHHILGWCALLIYMYILLGALWAAFFPSLHRIWGVGLVLFHAGTLLSLDLIFYHFPFFAGLFFIASPFAPERVDWRRTIGDLPIVGPAIRPFLRR